MQNDHVPLMDRLTIWASCNPCQIRRVDLEELIEMAELTDTPVHEQIAATPGHSIILRQEAVKAMMELAKARLSAVPAAVPVGKPRLRMSGFPPDRKVATRS